MFRLRLGPSPRFSYVHSRVQGAPRYPTLPTTLYYPNVRLSSGKKMTDATPEDKWKLEYAIMQGNRIQDPAKSSIQSTTSRRALIVTPSYKDHETVRTRGIKWMPTTIRDALLVYDTLTAKEAPETRKYNPADIRILADGFRFNGTSDPTRENIIHSLKWLVDGAKPGDHRFFYFSGHGVRKILTEEPGKGGKESTRVNDGVSEVWDTERAQNPILRAKGLLASHRIPDDKLVYYNEALVAQISSGIHGENTRDLPFYIYDSELNAQFANLPPGSNLTCVIDSCASGRILNNNVKLAGGGFRGAESTGVGGSILQGIGSAVKRAFQRDNIPEELPEEERIMDKIQANVFTWTACHQRQDSVPHTDLRSSLFTRVWTDTLAEDTDERPLTIGELFNKVSKETLKKAKKEKNYWQYAQLWTSQVDRVTDPELFRKKTLEKRVFT